MHTSHTSLLWSLVLTGVALMAILVIHSPGGSSTPVAIAASSPTATGIADLALSNSVNLASAQPQDVLEYTLMVTNKGPDAVSSALLTNTLPSGVDLVGSSPGFVRNGNVLTRTVNLGAPQATQTFTVAVRVLANAPAELLNQAQVSSDLIDPVPDDNQRSATTAVTLRAALDLSVAPQLNSIPVGRSYTYRLTLSNTGPADAAGGVVSATLSSAVLMTAVQPDQGNCTGLPCAIGTIPVGASRVLTITARAVAVGSVQGTFNLSSTTSDTEGKPNQITRTAGVVQVTQATTYAPLAVKFEIRRCNDIEDNDFFSQASLLTTLNAVCQGGFIDDPAREDDNYKFTISAGDAPATIELYLSGFPSDADYDLALYRNDTSTRVARSINPTGEPEAIRVTDQPPGTYYVRVNAYTKGADNNRNTYYLGVFVKR